MNRLSYQNHIKDFHPLILFIYFISILVFLVTLTNPVFVITGFAAWLFYVLLLIRFKDFIKTIFYSIPMIFFIALINPLFNHIGNTPLLYINDSPITLEALLYGIFTGVMIMSLIYLFKAFDRCIDSHKFIYLFGRIIPTIALMITMIMRFIPYFNRKLKIITQTQATMGVSTSQGSLKDRLKSGSNILSVLVSYSLEGTIDTADSMKARGYGLKGKTHYNTYILTLRDFVFSGFIIAFDVFFIIVLVSGMYKFEFYPGITKIVFDTRFIITIIIYFAFMGLPIIINLLEEIRWKLSRLKI